MWRNIASNAITLLILAVLGLAILVGWGQRQFTGPGPLEEAIYFEVPRGATIRTVSRDLTAAGAISSDAIFRIGADYTEMSDDLKFGTYEIPAGASMEEILAIVTKAGAAAFRYVAEYVIGVSEANLRLSERMAGSGEIVELAVFDPAAEAPPPAVYAEIATGAAPVAWRVTVVPGTTVRQVVNALREVDFLSGEIAAMPEEGTLAPDTYEVRPGETRAELITEMQTAQAAILATVWEGRQEELPFDTPEEALILASIIEKETGIGEERDVVASVFVNRLVRGMKLQTDPTVIYGITDGLGVLGRGIRQSELRRETPYNTYVIDGMPPTPIANPGRAAIEAAVNPAETYYLFFVADGTGGHVFAETLADHNRNVLKWRQIEAERNAAD
jgi:UPF0755 protein